MHNYARCERVISASGAVRSRWQDAYSWRVAFCRISTGAALRAVQEATNRGTVRTTNRCWRKCPPFFRDPNDPADSTFSSYYVLTGPSTVFFGKEGAKFPQIHRRHIEHFDVRRGQTRHSVDEAEDIPYDNGQAAPQTGADITLRDFIAALCDGAVGSFRTNVDQRRLTD